MRGVERERLQQLRIGHLWAVVGSARQPLRPTKANLLAYDTAVRAIHEAAPSILPARFGVVVENRERLRTVVLDRAAALKEALEAMEHKAQMTVRLFGVALPKNEGEWPAAPPQTSGRSYLEKRAAKFRPPNLSEVAALHRRLGRLVSRESFRLGPASALTLYHLIDKGRVPEYQAAVQECASEMPGVRVQVSGPFPPYAFAADLW